MQLGGNGSWQAPTSPEKCELRFRSGKKEQKQQQQRKEQEEPVALFMFTSSLVEDSILISALLHSIQCHGINALNN